MLYYIGKGAIPSIKAMPLKFRKYLAFEPISIVRELLSETHTRRGRTDVLFAGLKVWVVAPQMTDLRGEAMQIRARDIFYSKCEARAVASSEQLVSDEKIWSIKQLESFKKNIYMNIASLNDPMSKSHLARELEHASEGIDYAHRLVEIWHYLVASGLARQRKPSISAGIDLVSQIGMPDSRAGLKHLSSRTVDRAWAAFHESIAFSYSAKQIRIPGKDILFNLIVEDKLTRTTAKPILQQWFARAKYVDEAILSNLFRARNTKPRFPSLSALELPSEPFEPVPFSTKHTKLIRALYTT